jgi:hypothetical protein
LLKDRIAIVDREVEERQMTRMQHYFGHIFDASILLWKFAASHWMLDRALNRPVVPTKPIERNSELYEKIKALGEHSEGKTKTNLDEESKTQKPSDSDKDTSQTEPPIAKGLHGILPDNHPLRAIYSNRVPQHPLADESLSPKERHALEHQQKAAMLKLWTDGMKSVQFGGVFLNALMRKEPHHIPKGSIAIVGLTEAVGTKGRVTVQYTCIFQLNNNAVVSVGLNFGPVRAHNQWPKGGW